MDREKCAEPFAQVPAAFDQHALVRRRNRGLSSSDENKSYEPVDLAKALLTGKVCLGGVSVRADCWLSAGERGFSPAWS